MLYLVYGGGSRVKNKIIATVTLFFMTTSILLIILALNIIPLQLKLEVFRFELDEEISTNVADYINAKSSVIEQAQLNLSEVKNEVGVFPASVTYMGEVYPFFIKIVDTTIPVVKLKQVQFNISVGTTLEANDLLETIEESAGVIAYFDDEDGALVTSKEFATNGSYIENIIVKDRSGNQVAKLRVKIVVGDNGEIPTLSGIEEVTLTVGMTFDPLSGVIATDGKGNDISHKVEILNNSVNTQVAGIYEVIYKVTNDNGNYVQRSRRVVVIE
jgi:hypothetical protein